MEVTKTNFKTVLEELPEVLKNAQFLSFDTEFTGLQVEGATNLNYFDTLDDLYLKDRLKVDTFMVIQFGMVAFVYDKDTNKYKHQGYNFYVYPSSLTNVNFTCQNKTIEFLMQHGFDFNKLFRDGIPYLRDTEVESLVEKLEEKMKRNNAFENSSKMTIPPEHETTINGVLKNIEEILNSNTKKSFITERHNSYVRKLIYNSVQHKFGDQVSLESNKNETMTVSVGFSEEELKQKQNDKFLMEKNVILEECGFSKIIKLLIESDKLIVGHNLLLDLLFTIKQFLTPLPNTYKEFKELVKCLFPKILDTKYMASQCLTNIKETSLLTVIEHLESINALPVVEVIEGGVGYKKDDNKLHEAAYDAFLTGLSFIAMSEYLGKMNSTSKAFTNLPESPFLKPMLNKLFTPKLFDIAYMNIGGLDKEPDRQGVYHLTFPKEWTREDILEQFKNVGFVNISWINTTSAFIKIKPEYISEVEKNLGSHSGYKLCTFSEYKSSGENQSNLLSPLMGRRLGNSALNSTINGSSPMKADLTGMTPKRKPEEDIGEVIERPKKKQCLN